MTTTAGDTLTEMAAVVRTLFGVHVEAGDPPVAVPAAPRPSPPAAVPVPVPVPVPQSIPVPALVDPPPSDRHSLTMLNELAFLED